jgi:hypothetical protein
MMAVPVTGQRLRANLGDAERYIYELLLALAGSTAGTLGVEDAVANRATFGQAVCIGASGLVQGFRFADMRLDFMTPEKSAEPAWGAIPATPGTYGGTSTAVDYAAGGIALGVGAGMRIEMARQYPLREIPRARGSRARGPARGAAMRLIVTSHAVGAGLHLARYLEDLARQIGPLPVDLTGNGNTYADVVLESLRPRHTDFRATTFEAEFAQQL